jgi:hypothetical protein
LPNGEPRKPLPYGFLPAALLPVDSRFSAPLEWDHFRWKHNNSMAALDSLLIAL